MTALASLVDAELDLFVSLRQRITGGGEDRDPVPTLVVWTGDRIIVTGLLVNDVAAAVPAALTAIRGQGVVATAAAVMVEATYAIEPADKVLSAAERDLPARLAAGDTNVHQCLVAHGMDAEGLQVVITQAFTVAGDELILGARTVYDQDAGAIPSGGIAEALAAGMGLR